MFHLRIHFTVELFKAIQYHHAVYFQRGRKKHMRLTFLYRDAGFAILEQTNRLVSFPVSASSLHGRVETEADNKALMHSTHPAIRARAAPRQDLLPEPCRLPDTSTQPRVSQSNLP